MAGYLLRPAAGPGFTPEQVPPLWVWASPPDVSPRDLSVSFLLAEIGKQDLLVLKSNNQG